MLAEALVISFPLPVLPLALLRVLFPTPGKTNNPANLCCLRGGIISVEFIRIAKKTEALFEKFHGYSVSSSLWLFRRIINKETRIYIHFFFLADK